MNLLLSDTAIPTSLPKRPENHNIDDLRQLSISPFIGCFDYWVKTPGNALFGTTPSKSIPSLQKAIVYSMSAACFMAAAIFQ